MIYCGAVADGEQLRVMSLVEYRDRATSSAEQGGGAKSSDGRRGGVPSQSVQGPRAIMSLPESKVRVNWTQRPLTVTCKVPFSSYCLGVSCKAVCEPLA